MRQKIICLETKIKVISDDNAEGENDWIKASCEGRITVDRIKKEDRLKKEDIQ